MINHYRTALLNIKGSNWPGLEYPGEELVDPLFSEKILPYHISTARRLIFGENPDRAYLNYRLKQITTLWHDSILNEAALDKDSRVTYWPLKFSADMAVFGTVNVVSVNADMTPVLSYNSTPYADDKNGRAEFIYDATVTGDSCVVIEERSKKVTTLDRIGNDFNFGNNTKIYLGNGNWRVSAIGLPQKDLGQILTDCDLISNSDVEFLLFEGLASLKEMWKTSEFLPERLGAISLALAIGMSNIPSIKTT